MKSQQIQPIHTARSTADGVRVAPLSPEQFGRLRDILADYSGVYLDSARQRVLETGLAQRLQATGEDLASYERRIHEPAGRDELRQFAELVLNHETFFFRNGPHLRALREVLLPELHQRKQDGAPIRIWSAGCATGEEAYSLAIVAMETLGRPLARPVEIYATDLSELALRKARVGWYRGRSIGNLSPELLVRYFHPQDDGYIVGDMLRALVRFESLNLLDPFPNTTRSIDIIFCQNVTIYFQLETCRKLIERFYDCLPYGGLLCLGFSETLWNIFDGFRSREVVGAYIYSKETSTSVAPAPVEAHKTPAQAPQPTAQSSQQPIETRPINIQSTGKRREGKPRVSRYDKRSVHDQVVPPISREQSDEDALCRARELLGRGQITEALEALRHISPQSACARQALILAARAHADRGDLDLAAAEIHRALEIDTLNEDAYLLLGVIYGRQEQWHPAVQHLERARYLRPDSALVSFYLADAYRQLGRVELAAREYRNTLQKLDVHPPGALLDGVAVGWLRESCRRQLEYLPHIA